MAYGEGGGAYGGEMKSRTVSEPLQQLQQVKAVLLVSNVRPLHYVPAGEHLPIK